MASRKFHDSIMKECKWKEKAKTMPLTTAVDLVLLCGPSWKDHEDLQGPPDHTFENQWKKGRKQRAKGSGNSFRQESGNTTLRDWKSCWGLTVDREKKKHEGPRGWKRSTIFIMWKEATAARMLWTGEGIAWTEGEEQGRARPSRAEVRH